MKRKLVVIGAGMASGRMLEQLFDAAPDAYEVTLFNAEPRGNYNRLMLSPVLSGEKTYEQIVTHDADWYAAHGVDCRFGEAVVRIDRAARVVHSNKSSVGYDALVIATGSAPFIIPVPGKDLAGVVTYRDLEDTNAMIAASAPGAKAVVIGGGLLGLEAAAGMAARGARVTVIHLMGHLMERQLDPAAGYLLQKDLERRGITVHCQGATKAILGTDRAEAVLLEDGTVYPADLVCMAVGIRPEVRLANDAHLEVERGIVVDDALRTSDPHIFALGECVEHLGQVFGLVAPLYDQAKVLAQTLLDQPAMFAPVQTATKLKVTGIDLFSAGDFIGGEGTETITLSDPIGGVYKKLVIKDDVLVGACLYGDTADGGWYFRQVREGQNVAQIRDHLMFGAAGLGEGAIGDAGHQGQSKAMSMPDDMEVCGCNGVCKGTIVKAIQEHGLFSVDEVKKHTKAASSCGSCTGLVEQILINTVGGAADVKPKSEKAICGCSDLNHGQVRKAIREHHLISIPAAMAFMEWRTPNGCATCRPALNYYLISTWPGEAKDDPQSRFINERAHANIQKDGTYSVVPRMWGGVTNAAELRRIADVADKYQVPMVKVTGGQRIDLLGIRKEDLPGVWKDLDMPSGHAYGKSIRTVKTCVGSEFCRFGTQNSTQMGIDLEHALFNMWSPHKVKLAVSGCPRNCAESGIKDVGIIGVDSGWELYIGGNGGIKTEAGEFFVKVKSAEEVMEYSLAFLQLYREEAFYLERTVHYLQRVGMDHIKQAVLNDAERRKALHQRLLFSLSFEQDPWQEQLSKPQLKKEFDRIAVKQLENA